MNSQSAEKSSTDYMPDLETRPMELDLKSTRFWNRSLNLSKILTYIGQSGQFKFLAKSQSFLLR